MANRLVASSIASIISGGVAGYVLSEFQAPLNYAYLFMISSFFMLIGFSAFMSMDEPEKKNVALKEENFKLFMKNAIEILKKDRRLKQQIVVIFLGFSYFLSMPFVILNANKSFTLTGWMLGGFIVVQMIGSILGSTFCWRKIHDYEKMLSLSFIFSILSFVVALFAYDIYSYALVFLLFGISIDGFNIAGMNLVIEIAPEDKRPIYTALQTTLTSFGLFFPILGGVLLKFVSSFTFIYAITIVLLVIGYILSRRFEKRC